MRLCLLAVLLAVSSGPGSTQARAQAPGAPPSVGVVRVQKQPITETSEFVGRIQATDRVDLVARVTAFLEERLSPKAPRSSRATCSMCWSSRRSRPTSRPSRRRCSRLQAQLTNATITFTRAASLLHTPAGQQSTVDDARATMLADAAQVLAARGAAEAVRRSTSAIREIHAPISGKIGRTTVTVGNVVSPSSGTLATIVSQDPMYVVFPVSVRSDAGTARTHYADKGGFSAVVIKLRLPDGRLYGQTGKLDFDRQHRVAPAPTLSSCAARFANPPLGDGKRRATSTERELVDGEFVTVLLEGVEPVELLTIPRAAVLSDQQGDYVYTVDAENKVQQTRVQLGQSTPATIAGAQRPDRGADGDRWTACSACVRAWW